MEYLVFVMIIVAIICGTVVEIVKIGTNFCERVEKIKHGYPIDGVEPVSVKEIKEEVIDYRSTEYAQNNN